MSPTVFIPFAEQSGQIIELGRWVLEQAWRRPPALAATAADGDRDVGQRVRAPVHVAPDSRRRWQSVLDGASTDPELLTLEVTERVFVRDEERALVVLDELKDIGVKLALDDFGTGYSSLGYLKTLPIDTIKVDQKFIAKLNCGARQSEIVTAIIQLAHGLGMTVVSEGVETDQTAGTR